MTLVVEEPYPSGVPQTAVAGFAPRGVAWHWTAGGTGRAGWDGTVRHLVATRATVSASYHAGLWHEHAGERTIVQWIVPTGKAAHSIAPSQVFQYNQNKDLATQNARFTEVGRILARDSDPNADCIAVAYAGMPADLERDLACPVFRSDVQELGRQLVSHPSVIDRPHFGHGWIQPISRYEMDAPAADFIGLLYGEKQEDDMLFWRPVTEDWTTKTGARFWDGAGAEKVFTAGERVTSVAESSDGTYRLVRYPPTNPTELLIMERVGLSPIAGTRKPTTGYGFPPVSGVPKADYDAALAQVAALTKRIQTKDAHVAGYPKG